MPTPNDLFVDTSGWAYYLDRRDSLYPVIETIVKQAMLRRRRLVTTNYVLTELVVLLSSRYHLPRQQVVSAINAIKVDSRLK